MTDDATFGGQRSDDGGRIEDAELLRRYAEDRSEAAFAEFVHRHINLVYSAALRRTGGDAHAAADVAQHVFLAAARHVHSLARHPRLTGWLYAATRNAALNLMRDEHRRQQREREAQAASELLAAPTPDAEWERLRPVLDEAMDELNDQDREAVLLRFFEGRAFAEVGHRLNLSENTARMRVERALDKLHTLLAKRGVTSTSGALAAALAQQAVATAPAGLAASVAGSALSEAAVAVAGAGGLTALWTLMSASKIAVSLTAAGALAIATAVYQSNQARTTATALAVAGRDHAAARVRLAELEAKARAAEQALADREKTAVQLAVAIAPKPSAAASTAKDEAAKYQKALKEFLDNHPQMRMLKAEYSQVNWRAYHWPVLFGIGLTPEQAERAQEEYWARRKAQRDAGLKPPRDDLSFRAAFGDAATERWIEFKKVRWDEGEIVGGLFAANSPTDEPFTAQQTKRLLEIVKSAQTTKDGYILARYDWDRILADAGPLLSPAQMQVLRAKAAAGRNNVLYAAAAKEAAAAVKK